MEQRPMCMYVSVEEASKCGGEGRYCGSCGGRSRRRGLVGARGDGRRVAALCVAVCLSPRMESLPKGGYQLPFSGPSLAFSPALRFAHTCDLRCVMRRRLMCVHPFSPLPSSAFWNRAKLSRYARRIQGGGGMMHHQVERLVEVHQHFPFSLGGVVQCQRVEGVEG